MYLIPRLWLSGNQLQNEFHLCELMQCHHQWQSQCLPVLHRQLQELTPTHSWYISSCQWLQMCYSEQAQFTVFDLQMSAAFPHTRTHTHTHTQFTCGNPQHSYWSHCSQGRKLEHVCVQISNEMSFDLENRHAVSTRHYLSQIRWSKLNDYPLAYTEVLDHRVNFWWNHFLQCILYSETKAHLAVNM